MDYEYIIRHFRIYYGVIRIEQHHIHSLLCENHECRVYYIRGIVKISSGKSRCHHDRKHWSSVHSLALNNNSWVIYRYWKCHCLFHQKSQDELPFILTGTFCRSYDLCIICRIAPQCNEFHR